MNKIKLKKILTLFTVFFMLISSLGLNTNILNATTVNNEVTTTMEQEKEIEENEISQNKSEETGTIEDVLTETEKNNQQQENAPPVVMTEERASDNNLSIIGYTENGTAIYSSATKEMVEEFLSNPHKVQPFAAGTSSGMLTWMGTYSTPMIWLDGIGYVLCVEPYEAFPSGDWYDSGTMVHDQSIKALLIWGFPRNHGGQHGLSDEDAYLRTFVALNAYIGTYNRSTVQSYGDSYVNMLLSKADAQDVPNETYTVNSPANLESSYNITKNWLETDFYEVTGAVGSTYSLENQPSGFFMVDESGNEVSSLTIPSKFRVATRDLTYTGTVNFDIKSNISPMGAIQFKAPGVQTLMASYILDPLPGYGASAIFKAAFGNVIIPKTILDDTLNKNYNVDYTKFTIEIFDANNVSQGIKTINNTTKTAEFNDLLIGDYTWVETNNDPNINKVLARGSFTIQAGETITVENGNNPTNEISGGYITGTKAFINNSTETYPWDYTKISFKVEGEGINKTYPADANFSFKTDRLKLGTYKVTEINTDAGTVIVKGTATVTITSNNQTVVLDGANQITNTVANVDLKLLKKDSEWLTPILKPAEFGLYDYDVTTGTVGSMIASGNINLIGSLTFKNIQIGQSGKREVIVLEHYAPDNYHLDTKGVRLTLTTAQHTQTITFDYLNVPEFFTSAEVIKTNHLGEPLADIPFVLERLDTSGDIVEEVEHILTNRIGFARFQNVPSNDQDNNAICYQIRELRSEDNKYYILNEPYKFCGDKNVKIVKYQATNEPKKLVAPIHKMAEANPVGITSDNSIWGLYNANDELIDQVTILNNYGELVDLTYEELSEDIASNYWQEISTGNDALVLDTNKYYLPATDWMTIEDGDSISVADNTATTPFINKIKMVAVESLKINEYGKALQGVEFDLFAEDTILDPGTEAETVVQNKVESLTTDANGKFVTSFYPIYMFNGTNLSYMQEIATLENLVLITQKYNVPVIAASDYVNISDGEVIPLLENNDPITNFNLRLNLGLYKMNEDQEFLPGVTYGLYDQNKRQLATGITDQDGMLLLENLRFDIFVNKDTTAKNVEVYIREIKVQDADKYTLDYTKYYLPNLAGKQGEYTMGDTILLNTKETAYVNDYLRGDVELIKVDENNDELPLANATFKFERLTGKDVEAEDAEDTTENTATVDTEETTENNEGDIEEETTLIDVKQTFELTTDENGKINKTDLLYGDWCVTEINAPEGYILPVDSNGVPNNKLCFTINAATKKINMKFYNQKAPEILVETGENDAAIGIMIGIVLIALAGTILLYVHRKKKLKHLSKFVAVMLLAGIIGISQIPLSAATQTNNPEISVVPHAIDPVEDDGSGEYDPIEGTEPSPGDDATIIGDKPVVPEVPVAPETPTETPSDDTFDDTIHTSYQSNSDLVTAGENNYLYVIGSLITIASGCLFIFASKTYKEMKRK